MGTPSQELKEFNVLHLIVDLLLGRFQDDMHFAHPIAIGNFVLIWDYLIVLRHQFDAVVLIHVFLSRGEVRLVNLIKVPLIGMQDFMCLVAPPNIVPELLPLLSGTQSEAIIV